MLFVLGFFWAFWSLALLFAPIGIFMEEYNYQLKDTILSIAGFAFSLIGYFVWINWGNLAIKGKLIFLSENKFWILCIVQNLSWVFFFYYWYSPVGTVSEYLADFLFSPMGVWITAVTLISLLSVVGTEGRSGGIKIEAAH
ncbi:MAG: hypothetical protein AAF546_14860 [Verrucomicrobiota bacterium]